MGAETTMARTGQWRPTLAIRLSALTHGAAVLLVVGWPAHWPWALAAIAANHALLSGAVLWPRGRILGPNLVRLPEAAVTRGEVSLNFDDGPDPDVTPRVLDLLDRHRASASFFCIGARAAAHPDLVREIARRGHSVENHSHRHSAAFALFGIGGLRREIDATQDLLAELTGRSPEFFRAPAGFRSPLLDPLLARRGMRYISWTRRGFDTVDANGDRVLGRLVRGLAAGDVLLLHDGSSARTPGGGRVVLDVLPRLLARLDRDGLKPVSLPAAFRNGPSD